MMSGTWFRGGDEQHVPDLPRLDTSVAHVARVYDYLLGGKDNFRADREAAEAAIAAYPGVVDSVRSNRAFLERAVRYLAGEAGIRQFLDIGTGIPTASNTHEVAQSIAPECRVVYADSDPIVLAHARALLASSPEGATAYLHTDLRDTDRILAEAAKTLDFSRPVAIMLVAVLHFIPDEDDPHGIVTRLLDAVPPGSHLTVTHPGSDLEAEVGSTVVRDVGGLMAQTMRARTHDDISRFFAGLEIAEPGLVRVPHWRPDSEHTAARSSNMWGGVGRRV